MIIEKIAPIEAPSNGWDLVALPEKMRDAVQQLLSSPEKLKKWSSPQNIPVRMGDPEFVAYWLAKSCNPIVEQEDLPPHIGSLTRLSWTNTRQQRDLGGEGNELVLSAVGDLAGAPGLDRTSSSGLYAEIRDRVFDADIRFANLEYPVGPGARFNTLSTGTIPPRLSVSAGELDVLLHDDEKSFNVLNLANNHILDFGEAGLDRTVTLLNNRAISAIGVTDPHSADERAPRIIEVGGMKTGWVAYTFPPISPTPGAGRVHSADFEGQPDQTKEVVQQIKMCSKHQCDLIVLSLHWGMEFELRPRVWQIEKARLFAEAGADIIIGHHPHVAQPIEFYRTKNGARNVPIAYSLGNLIPPISHPASVLSLVLKSRFRKPEGRRKAEFSDLEVLPVVAVSSGAGDRSQPAEIRIVPLEKLENSSPKHPHRPYFDRISRYADNVLGRNGTAQ